MYNLYELTMKTDDSNKASKLVEDNPFVKPCIFTITGDLTSSRDVFGTSKNILKMARLRTRDDHASCYSVKDFPIKFLALKFDHDLVEKDEYMAFIVEFVNKYFIPLIIKDNVLFDKEIIKNNFRNINIISYCDAASDVIMFVNFIKEKLISFNFDIEDIKDMMKEITVISLANSSDLSNLLSTTIDIFDVNDQKFLKDGNLYKNGIIQDDYVKTIRSSYGILNIKDNYASLLFKGSGIHDIKEYTNNKIFLIMAKIINNLLNNLLDNKEINVNILTEGIDELLDKNIDDIKKEIKEFDSKIEFRGVLKLDNEWLEYYDKLDKYYDSIKEN